MIGGEIVIMLLVLVISLFFVNELMGGKLIPFIQSIPKIFALIIALLAIFFPRDISFIPNVLLESNMMKLQKINKRNVRETVKKYVAAEQQWRCNKCGDLLSAAFEIDHIIPLYKGGSNEAHNLQALCRNCHGMKTVIDRINQ